jgi:succinate dehydrogenase / fumarate reductase iron-sulfur subunit
MKIRFKIKRFDPETKDRRSSFIQAYDVDVIPGMTVLEALFKIADELDPTLSFRRSCRSAICGSCAMTINGFSKLACNTQVLPEHKKHGHVSIEPLANHNVLKDLIVDFSDFWAKIDKITPYLTPSEEKTGVCKIMKENAEAIDDAQKCIMCGCCNGSCNALEIDRRYGGPSAFAKAWRFVGDVREGGSRRRLERLSEEHGIWDCVRCVHCTQYCPKGVTPLSAIEKLRSAAIAEGITDNHGAKHAVAMYDSIKRVGRLDEAAMTFKTLGFIRSLGMIPWGLKMQLHGKMPHPLLFPAIDGIDEVKKIYEAWEETKKEKEGKKKGKHGA